MFLRIQSLVKPSSFGFPPLTRHLLTKSERKENDNSLFSEKKVEKITAKYDKLKISNLSMDTTGPRQIN